MRQSKRLDPALEVSFAFAVSLLLKQLIFHFITLGGFPTHPEGFLHTFVSVSLFILPKISFSLLISSFIFLFESTIWTIIFSLFTDIWLTSNFLYYKANNLFIDFESIKMFGNLAEKGVLHSISGYLVESLIFLGITIIYIVIIAKRKLHHPQKSKKRFWIYFLFGFVFIFPVKLNQVRLNMISYYEALQISDEKRIKELGVFGIKALEPFHDVKVASRGNSYNILSSWEKHYVSDYSILSYFPAMFVFNRLWNEDTPDQIDEEEIAFFLGEKENCNLPKQNLLIILLESFESWLISDDEQLFRIAPNLSRFSHNENVLYCNKVKSQVLNGVSGDAQLIINTGLLPVQRGAACQLYGGNTYPNIAGAFASSAIINPWPHIWNQDVVTHSYGYKNLIEPQEGRWNDSEVIEQLLTYLSNERNEPQCIMAITMSSHLPFDLINDDAGIDFPVSASPILSRYVNSQHYTDKCIGRLINEIEKGVLNNYTIVITGDHNVFKGDISKGIYKINGINSSFSDCSETYTPLFIYDTSIKSNRQISEICYQMDIYPTIASLCEIPANGWRGFGIDLINNRICTDRSEVERTAYSLSDRLIRLDYFGGQK